MAHAVIIVLAHHARGMVGAQRTDSTRSERAGLSSTPKEMIQTTVSRGCCHMKPRPE